MDEQPQPDPSAEAVAPEASTPAASGDQDEAAIATTESEPVDTSAGSAPDLQQQEEGGEDETQPPASSGDDQAKDATEQQPQEIEEAGTGAGNEQAAEQGEGANKEEGEEEGAAAAAGGEGSKTSFSLRNPKSAMVVLILLEGDETSLEKRVSERTLLFTHCGRLDWCVA